MDDRITYYRPKQFPDSTKDDTTFAILNKQSKDLVIVFTGGNKKFGCAINVLYDKFLGEKPNLLVLGDPKGMLFLTGLPAFGKDLESTFDGLKSQIDQWGINRVFTLGNSGGCFGSIYYGMRIGAQRSMGFGPFTCYKPEFEPKVTMFLSRRSRDKDVTSKVPEELLDLAVAIPMRNAGTDILLYYGEGHANDKRHAEHLKGVEGVTLVPVSYSSSHGVVVDLKRQRDLSNVLSGLFTGEFPPLKEKESAELEAAEAI